jgi:hypothetical protein
LPQREGVGALEPSGGIGAAFVDAGVVESSGASGAVRIADRAHDVRYASISDQKIAAPRLVDAPALIYTAIREIALWRFRFRISSH